MRLTREARRAGRSLCYGIAAIAFLSNRLNRCLGQREDSIAGNVGRHRGCSQGAHIDERHCDTPRRQQAANEVGLAPFRVEGREQEDGRHRLWVTIPKKTPQLSLTGV